MALQFVFALIVLKTEWGKATINYLGLRFMELSKHADSGSEFVFTQKYYKEFRFLFSVRHITLLLNAHVYDFQIETNIPIPVQTTIPKAKKEL